MTSPATDSQALWFLHNSPHYERLMQQPPVLPGYDLSLEWGERVTVPLVCHQGRREPSYLSGSLSSVNSLCIQGYSKNRIQILRVSKHPKSQRNIGAQKPSGSGRWHVT
ncbi:hypothetical protein AVEN_270084-1 [Araneus ventricosus]|uniref:Uncharacterized protein n=1 Tax=Araneus ventricosus TaxID=182803 RepID=A0A4Y2VKR3_ARAVE|nr:hypothetical protein AVEN_270084-1 [Araneus ventricosus]